MRFQWDDNKRDINRKRHKLDLLDGEMLFDGRNVVTKRSPRNNELRYVTTGLIGAKFYTLVWMERDGEIRLISFRRARDGEERAYKTRFG